MAKTGIVLPRKFAHSSFSSLVHYLLPKDNLFKNILPLIFYFLLIQIHIFSLLL